MTTTFAQKNLQATEIFLPAHQQTQTPNANAEQDFQSCKKEISMKPTQQLHDLGQSL
jgi:hypothetical protein